MTKTVREQNRLAFMELLAAYELTRKEAAELLYVSVDTMNSWLKPEDNRSANPLPRWAPELLTFKMKAAKRRKKRIDK